MQAFSPFNPFGAHAMKPSRSSLAIAVATIAAAAAVGPAQAVPQHLPAVDPLSSPSTLYSITFYDDTSFTHNQWATQNICLTQGPSVGSNTTGIWYSTTYYNWIGRWRQEGDQIFMIGDFWGGPGNDAIQVELVTTRDEGFGHWEEWVEDGSYGWWPAKGNARVAKLGTCLPLMAATEGSTEATWEEIEQAALRQAAAAPVRYRKDGSLAQPTDRDQLPPK
jgi:hypothetical protein